MPKRKIQIDDNFWLCDAEQIDASELFRLVKKNKSYLSAYLPWVNTFNSQKVSGSFIKRSSVRKAANLEDYYLLLQDDFIIGALTIKTEKQLPGYGEAGYWISENYSGRGLTTLALMALVRFTFQKKNLTRLFIRTRPGNVAAIRVAEKCGFRMIDANNSLNESEDFLYFELEKSSFLSPNK